MDDSDQDFSVLCSRLLKRVRRKGESGDEKKEASKDEESDHHVQNTVAAAVMPAKRKASSKRKRQNDELLQTKVTSRTQPDKLPNGGGQLTTDVAVGTDAEGAGGTVVGVKEKVVRRMQRFKRASPPRLLHTQKVENIVHSDRPYSEKVPHPPTGLLEQAESDEVLARRLQEQLDGEARAQGDVEDGGLFLCQLCHKDLSAMSPRLRTQHINRCLDKHENDSALLHAAPPPPPSHPRLPGCPVCGRCFKSEKSLSVHLKRCAVRMGVSTTELLQALQRQAAEHLSDSAANQLQQAGGSRSAATSSLPVRKKGRRKALRVDEDTMLALALSRSLLEHEKERERDRNEEEEEERQIQTQLMSAAAPPTGLQWRPAAAPRRRGRKASPLPLLLTQDPRTAPRRIQERVSSLLLWPRPPTPPTPALAPSTLFTCKDGTPFWLKSALPRGGPNSVCDFYTPELGAFIQPWEGPEENPLARSEGSPQKQRLASVPQPAPAAASAPSALGTPGTQGLHDLVELAEECMTLTQYTSPGETAALRPSPETEAVVVELPPSGFVPETTETTVPPTSTVASVSVSRLCSDLSSMVNNPQLSDVQLQVDSGEVYFAHLFMLYTRCPLLVNMVHNAGFGVQEEDLPRGQRVLLGDVPGEAVFALLKYLYTACCPLTHTLLPHILQLARRFGLSELQQQCEQFNGHPEDRKEDAREDCPGREPLRGPQQSLAEAQFLELLRSMWQHEESDGEEFEEAGGSTGASGEEKRDGVDGMMKEERVDEEELDEIYEFAATQKKIGVGAKMALDSDDEVEDEEGPNNCLKETEHADEEMESANACTAFFKEASTSCHSYRLGEGRDADTMVTSPTDTHHAQGLPGPIYVHSDAHTSPKRHPDSSLDRSYSDMFSQSWGEYAEPSETTPRPPPPVAQRDPPGPCRQPLISEVIDLSVSPPAEGSGEVGEPSLPVAGVSPGEVEQGGGGRPDLYRQSPAHSPPSGRSVSGPMNNTCSKHPSSEPSAARPKPLWSGQRPGPDLAPLGPSRDRQPELIVLSDSSDDADVNVVSGKVSPLRDTSTSLFPSPLRLSRSTTEIGTKDSVVSSSPRRTDKTDSHVAVCIERYKSDQLEGTPRDACAESMLDGSAEVSWLIPATPEAFTRTNSTQTHCSMRLTHLGHRAQSSLSSSSSSSSPAPEVTIVTHAHSSFGTENLASRRPHPEDCSHRQHSSPGVPECSADFQKSASHAASSSLSDTPRGDSAKRAVRRPQSPSQPCSSTPLPSHPPLPPLHPLGSPLLRGCKLRPHAGSGREGSPSSLASPHRGPPHGSSSQAEGSVTWEEAGEMALRTSMEPACVEIDAEMGTEEKEEEETKGVKRRCGDEVMKAAEDVLDEGEGSWAFDEPPMAFDDSWGLAGTVEDKAARFSLRLESSEGQSTPPEHRGPGRATSPGSSPHIPSPPEPGDATPHGYSAPANHSLPDPAAWDSWEEDAEDGPVLHLSQRVALAKRVAQLKTPVAHKKKNEAPLQPITPMPIFSDMDTPELKTRLNRYGVRPLPKKQMVLKLKEIHQYTHQLMSSESEGEASPLGRPKARLPLAAPVLQPARLTFKKPIVPPSVSPKKLQFGEDEHDALPGSQDSNTSTAESDRSNPELCSSDDEDSDSDDVMASQAVVRERDRLAAARSFIMSHPHLYRQVLQYQPLSLASLKTSLRAAGIRLGTARLLDLLDSQCITFSTAKPSHVAPSRRRARVRAPDRAAGRGRKRAGKPE